MTEDTKVETGAGNSKTVFQIDPTYHHSVGAGGDAFLCDGEVELEDRRVRRPVWSPFALFFGVHGVEG